MKHKLWAPRGNLPWKAIRKGNDRYVWYEIVNKFGWEVCSFGGVIEGTEDADEQFREMAFVLTQANGSNQIDINGEVHEIFWMGEKKEIG